MSVTHISSSDELYPSYSDSSESEGSGRPNFMARAATGRAMSVAGKIYVLNKSLIVQCTLPIATPTAQDQ